jgi:hypothetical protein
VQKIPGVAAVLIMTLAAATLTACAPEVGSEKWCAKMKEKPKKEWTAEEAGDYAKHCVFE